MSIMAVLSSVKVSGFMVIKRVEDEYETRWVKALGFQDWLSERGLSCKISLGVNVSILVNQEAKGVMIKVLRGSLWSLEQFCSVDENGQECWICYGLFSAN